MMNSEGNLKKNSEVLVFFADGFEEIEAFTSVDVMRRAGLNVEMVTVTPDEIVTGAHDVPVLCDKNVVNCDFFDAELVLCCLAVCLERRTCTNALRSAR